MDNIENLRELKTLLDEGIITQEQFDENKERILFPEKKKKEEETISLIRAKIQNDDFDEAKKIIDSSVDIVDVKALKDELNDKMISSVYEKTKANSYDDAFKLLDCIPEDAQGKDKCTNDFFSNCLSSARDEIDKVEPDKALKLIEYLPDDYDGKAEVVASIPELYIRKSNDLITNGNISAAEMMLSNVEDGDPEKDAVLERIASLKARDEAEKQRKIKTIKIATLSIISVIALAFIVKFVGTQISVNNKYNNAIALYESGKYEDAQEAFKEIDADYKDTSSYLDKCYKEVNYQKGVQAFNDEQMMDAYKYFEYISSYKDASDYLDKLDKYAYVLSELRDISSGDYTDYGKKNLEDAISIIDESEIQTDELSIIKNGMEIMLTHLGPYHQKNGGDDFYDGEFTALFGLDVEDDLGFAYSLLPDRFNLDFYDNDGELLDSFVFTKGGEKFYLEDGNTLILNDDGTMTIEDEDGDKIKFIKGEKKSSGRTGADTSGSTRSSGSSVKITSEDW